MSNDGMLATTSTMWSFTAAAGLSVVVVAVCHFWMGRNPERSAKQRQPPPMANTTLFETIREITGGGLREFLIGQFQQKGGVFRLPLPATVVVVANTADARAIYKSADHLKPAVMYKRH